MTAMAVETSAHTETGKTLFTIWAEGFAATGESQTAWQLNESPIQAETLDDAVRQYSFSSDSRHLFRRHKDGTWTYWGCRLFDNEADARGAFG
ncbi:hypothetical protein [Paenarthrobacter sp. YJN-5]|uniref:hypothetical protein n=1 Tax=Paenarthrobacter sp. YJN-5 TaxID=2735316 RepID=UPI001877CBB4|nr:hypothetical protein [Paenarthrobacter sp. YJN-5]QOT19258.1 hypothetical protein HMI59_21350 [Paenarthrobacter sp. YJN-5]